MNEYKKALSEVNTIILNMPKELSDKIPSKFKKIIEQEKDNNYNPNINNLVIQNHMLSETVVILGLIYRDFLCSNKEREKLQLQDKEYFEKLIMQENGKQEKFNYDNLFHKHIQEKKEEIQLLEVKKKWYVRALEYFRRKIRFEK